MLEYIKPVGSLSKSKVQYKDNIKQSTSRIMLTAWTSPFYMYRKNINKQ